VVEERHRRGPDVPDWRFSSIPLLRMRIVDPHYFYLISSELLVNDFATTFLIFPDHIDNKLHGQGFIAPTSWKLTGKVSEPCARLMFTSRF
jgi:hypothetical protein